VLAQRAASEGPSLDARKGDHPSHLLKWWFAAAFPAATARPGAQGVGRVRKRTFLAPSETGVRRDWWNRFRHSRLSHIPRLPHTLSWYSA